MISAFVIPDGGAASGVSARDLMKDSLAILPRQSSDLGFNLTSTDEIPAECKSRCAILGTFQVFLIDLYRSPTYLRYLKACDEGDTSCVCSNDNASKFAECINCVLDTMGEGETTDQVEDAFQDLYNRGYSFSMHWRYITLIPVYQSSCGSAGVDIQDADINSNAAPLGWSVSVTGMALVSLVFATLL